MNPKSHVVPLDPKWNELLDASWIQDLDDTPFLTRCREGSVTLFELDTFIIQQFHYARHFTRYLCALMGNLPQESDRSALASNLFEELGLSGGTGVAHAVIYRQMMVERQLDDQGTPAHPETLHLVKSMLTACSNSDPLVGLGALCLGAEAIVPHVYSQIVSGFLSVGESLDRLKFFTIHIEDDDEHAVTMRKIIDREISADPRRRQTLRESARKLLVARGQFMMAIRPSELYENLSGRQGGGR